MSMLAERKRKTKWVINPTKKPVWTEGSDGIKFGKELMEKMGWSAGKGLGANEQGIKEPLKVSYKNDTKGMGFKGNDDDWIEQQDEFNVLLNQLRSSNDSSVVKLSEEEKNEIKSLEEKSKLSKARVHYQKFTRGKDLSRYTENDLACILGTNKAKKEKHKTEEVTQSDEKTNSQLTTSFGVTTINSGSIQDYFKKKWINDKAHVKNASKANEENGDEFCDEEKPSFSTGGEEILKLERKEKSKKEHKSEDGALDEAEVVDSDEKCKKKKKKRKKEGDEGANEGEEPKSKKRKNSFNGDNIVNEELQGGLVGEGEIEGESLGNENDCDVLRKRKKEKKQLKLSKECLEEKVSSDGVEAMVENCSDLVEVKKKKKKKEKKEKLVENGYCEIQEASVELVSEPCLESQYAEVEEEPVRKKKKKRKNQDDHKKESVGDSSLDVSVGNENGMIEEKADKQKKKKKYTDHCVKAQDEQTQQGENLSKENDVDECNGVSKKKKKKKEKKEVEYHSSKNDIPAEGVDESGQGEKKKKKKHKHKTQEKENSGSANHLEETCKGDLNASPDAGTEAVKGKMEGEMIGMDKVEMINQRAAYEHIPGQHSYERVKNLFKWVNFRRFGGSNLEGLDGYGQKILRKHERIRS